MASSSQVATKSMKQTDMFTL